MKFRKGLNFRQKLSKVLPELENFEHIFKMSPALYNYYIDKTRKDNRVANANVIMKVSGSANAKSIEEYLRCDKLRLIFMTALPIIKLSQYNSKNGSQYKFD
jgi:hypothetical protein